MKRLSLIALFLLLIVSVSAAAHSGGTDSSGGHHVGGTGEYHYHHGYPAHQHENGVCPYDFKDRSGSSSGSTKSDSHKISISDIISALFLLGLAIFFLWMYYLQILEKNDVTTPMMYLGIPPMIIYRKEHTYAVKGAFCFHYHIETTREITTGNNRVIGYHSRYLLLCIWRLGTIETIHL